MDLKNPFEEESGLPQLSSLIDVLFLLLVFFMLTTTFDKGEGEEQKIDLELPTAMTSTTLNMPNDIIIVRIDRRGQYSVDDVACSEDDLFDRVESAKSSGRDAVLILGDRRAPYQALVKLYDVVQVLGIEHLAHEVEDRR